MTESSPLLATMVLFMNGVLRLLIPSAFLTLFQNFQRIEENINKGCQYSSLVFNDECTDVLLAGNDGFLRQVVSGASVNETPQGTERVNCVCCDPMIL